MATRVRNENPANLSLLLVENGTGDDDDRWADWSQGELESASYFPTVRLIAALIGRRSDPAPAAALKVPPDATSPDR